MQVDHAPSAAWYCLVNQRIGVTSYCIIMFVAMLHKHEKCLINMFCAQAAVIICIHCVHYWWPNRTKSRKMYNLNNWSEGLKRCMKNRDAFASSLWPYLRKSRASGETKRCVQSVLCDIFNHDRMFAYRVITSTFPKWFESVLTPPTHLRYQSTI
jgi:hypothetical protein